ncbi:MAG: helix-turn-helix transcriptional regulator [Dehalococcoidia bacterium]|nr:helix-turn-helix transcriptional regulator [Dehalococcoidia bacterium]
MTTFGEHLRHLREKKGWTLRELERRSGVSNPYLAQIEKGDRHASAAVLQKLAQAYNVPAKYFMEQAGYLDDVGPASDEEERVQAAFDYVMADPDYKLGARIRGEGFDIEAKKGIVIVYETLSGKRLLTK